MNLIENLITSQSILSMIIMYIIAMRALVISAIVLVAVIMGFSAVAPMIPQAEAEHPCTNPREPGDQEDHACGNENRPTCDEIEAELRDRGLPEQAIRKFMEHCVE